MRDHKLSSLKRAPGNPKRVSENSCASSDATQTSSQRQQERIRTSDATEMPVEMFPAHNRIVRLTFCTYGQVRIRKIVMRSRARATGKYPSWKTGRMMQWESINELNAFRVLDCLSGITTYAEQPCEIVYLDDDVRQARHYPDIFVLVNGARELWEIKPQKGANSHEIRRRTEILMQELRHYGITYRLQVAEQFCSQPRLDNCNVLLRFGRRPVSEREHWRVEQILTQLGNFSWESVCLGVFGPRSREVVCRLALEGVLQLDMNSPIDSSTKITAKLREANSGY
jgi:hypothetical protein